MKKNVRFNPPFILIPLSLLMIPSLYAMSGVTGCTGASAQFCNLTASCIQSNNIIANSFATPAGPFVGIGNYGVLTNQATVVSGNNILWAATPAGNLSAGIVVNTSTGNITLPTTGLFLVEYTVRFTRAPYEGTSTAIAQLQQTIAGTPTNITQSAITQNVAVDGLTFAIPQSNPLVTGWALIRVTSTANNVINLQLSYGGNDTFPVASGVDANAQMMILQLG